MVMKKRIIFLFLKYSCICLNQKKKYRLTQHGELNFDIILVLACLLTFFFLKKNKSLLE
jgi:hypothetical protein